jgi:hypothetical protein
MSRVEPSIDIHGSQTEMDDQTVVMHSAGIGLHRCDFPVAIFAVFCIRRFLTIVIYFLHIRWIRLHCGFRCLAVVFLSISRSTLCRLMSHRLEKSQTLSA